MKNKLRFLIIILVLLLLVGCKKLSITYTDSETGNEETLVVKETSDPEEVRKTLYAIMSCDVPFPSPASLSIDLDCTSKYTFSDGIESLEAKEKIKINILIDKDAKFRRELDLIASTYVEMIQQIEGTLSYDHKTEEIKKSTIKSYLSYGNQYCYFDVDELLLKNTDLVPYAAKNYNGNKQLVRMTNNIYNYSKSPLMDEELAEELSRFLKGQMSIRESFTEEEFEKATQKLQGFIEKFNIEITEVKKTKVTFSLKIDEKSLKLMNISFVDELAGLDSAETSLTVTIDLIHMKIIGGTYSMIMKYEKEYECEETGSFTVTYDANIEKISQAEIDNAARYH